MKKGHSTRNCLRSLSCYVKFVLESISGYGNNAPDSYIARMFVIVYIFFGIPLFLITLADLVSILLCPAMTESGHKYIKISLLKPQPL